MVETGNKIKEFRESIGLSQEELAEALEVSRQTVYRWETGEVDPPTGKLALLSQKYGVSLDELMGKAPPVEEPPLPEEDWSRARRKKLRLTVAAALLLAVGFLIGAWCFSRPQGKPPIPSSQIPGEVIDFSAAGRIPILPPTD